MIIFNILVSSIHLDLIKNRLVLVIGLGKKLLIANDNDEIWIEFACRSAWQDKVSRVRHCVLGVG